MGDGTRSVSRLETSVEVRAGAAWLGIMLHTWMTATRGNSLAPLFTIGGILGLAGVVVHCRHGEKAAEVVKAAEVARSANMAMVLAGPGRFDRSLSMGGAVITASHALGEGRALSR